MIYFGFGFWKVEQNDQIFEAFRPTWSTAGAKRILKFCSGFQGFEVL